MRNSCETLLLSYIVPVYNVEKYLPECIDSIKKQTYPFFECILVDDGSTDLSGKICDTIASIDCRFRVIHKKNGGLSDARNAGLAVARGQYVGFIDSDDWIEQDMFQEMLASAEKNHLDIVCCDVQTFDDRTHEICPRKELCSFCKDDEVVSWRTTNNLIGALNNMSVWNKLFSLEFLHNTGDKFPLGVRYEDIIFWSNVFFKAERVGCIAKTLYNYRVSREGSIVQEFDYRALVHSYEIMIQTLQEYDVLDYLKDDLIATLIFKLVHCLIRSQKKFRADFYYGMKYLLQKCGKYSFCSNNNITIRFFIFFYALLARMPYCVFFFFCIPFFVLSYFSLLNSLRKRL